MDTSPQHLIHQSVHICLTNPSLRLTKQVAAKPLQYDGIEGTTVWRAYRDITNVSWYAQVQPLHDIWEVSRVWRTALQTEWLRRILRLINLSFPADDATNFTPNSCNSYPMTVLLLHWQDGSTHLTWFSTQVKERDALQATTGWDDARLVIKDRNFSFFLYLHSISVTLFYSLFAFFASFLCLPAFVFLWWRVHCLVLFLAKNFGAVCVLALLLAVDSFSFHVNPSFFLFYCSWHWGHFELMIIMLWKPHGRKHK